MSWGDAIDRVISLSRPLRDENYETKAWLQTAAGSDKDPTHLVRQVGMIRFDRDDGLDPRVCPEPEGTHLAKHAPHNQLQSDGRILATCGKLGKGFTDYGPITGITCPSCAAELAALLLREENERWL